LIISIKSDYKETLSPTDTPPISMMIAHCYSFVLLSYIPWLYQGYISRNYLIWLKTFALRLAAPPRVWEPFRVPLLKMRPCPSRSSPSSAPAKKLLHARFQRPAFIALSAGLLIGPFGDIYPILFRSSSILPCSYDGLDFCISKLLCFQVSLCRWGCNYPSFPGHLAYFPRLWDESSHWCSASFGCSLFRGSDSNWNRQLIALAGLYFILR